MGAESGGLQFFLNQKKYIAVISFIGRAGRSDIEQLAKCYDLIGTLSCKYVVFNFGGVTEIADELNPALVRLQVCVREGGKELSICGLVPQVKKRLVDSGIIRTYETAATLVEALQKIVSAVGAK